MRLLFIVAVFLCATQGANGATVAGELVDGRLELRFRAAPGERNELRVVPHESGVRFAGSGPVVAGSHCRAVREGDVRCGPRPPGGLEVHARTGDAADFVFARVAHIAIETLRLGKGDDEARGNGYMAGGPGKDDLRVIRGGATFYGGAGEDVLIGGRFRDLLDGGPGPDLAVGGRRFDEISGGRGPDQLGGGFGPDAIFAGPGDDRVRAADPKHDLIRCGAGPRRGLRRAPRRDDRLRARRLGLARLSVYASLSMSRLADLRLLLLLPR